MAKQKRAVVSEEEYRRLGYAHKAGSEKAYSSLRSSYHKAKAARRAAGKVWNANKNKTNYDAYRAAEAAWQATGQKLGSVSGSHRPRRKWHPGMNRWEQNVTQINRTAYQMGKIKSRRKKNTKTSRRR